MFLENSIIGVTKDKYLEMCRELGNEPLEEEIPPSLEDFPYIVEQSFAIFYKLADKIDGFNGIYLGKDLSNIDFYFNMYSVEDRQSALEFITIIDRVRQEIDKRTKKNGSKLLSNIHH